MSAKSVLSDDLLPYNPKYVPTGQGFVNLGATCYFNSILQCILSCPSIYEVLNGIRDTERIKTNTFARYLLALWDAAIRGEPIFDKCIPVWRYIIAISQKQANRVQMGMGQQDSHEGFMMFLDAIETIPEVRRLFEHRHQIQIFCETCQEYVSNIRETNLVFEVQANLKSEQLTKFKNVDEFYDTSMKLNDFLRKQNGYVDKDHQCSKCNQRSERFKTVSLTMVPEIIPILLKKYQDKVLTDFPSKLHFNSKGSNKKLEYILVAQSEHSGSAAGGHYWAICQRSDGWKNLNDSSVSPANPGPTLESYMIFYHFAGYVDDDSLMPMIDAAELAEKIKAQSR